MRTRLVPAGTPTGTRRRQESAYLTRRSQQLPTTTAYGLVGGVVVTTRAASCHDLHDPRNPSPRAPKTALSIYPCGPSATASCVDCYLQLCDEPLGRHCPTLSLVIPTATLSEAPLARSECPTARRTIVTFVGLGHYPSHTRLTCCHPPMKARKEEGNSSCSFCFLV